jgi:hypothetical protein
MSNLIYDLSIAPLLDTLKNLDAIVSKAEAHVEADENLAGEIFIQGRLYPNMRPFIFQIQVATDSAKGVAARLSGTELPSWPDDETTFADTHARIRKTIDYLSKVSPEDFAGAETREIKLELGQHVFKMTGQEYISVFVLPNFYFHVTTAYNILRHFGVDIGKKDFLAGMGRFAEE